MMAAIKGPPARRQRESPVGDKKDKAREAGWLALLGVALGSALGTVWVWLLTEYGIDLSALSGEGGGLSAGGVSMGNRLVGKMSVRVFTEPALVVFFATLAFALLPSLKMARMKPTEAMADKG